MDKLPKDTVLSGYRALDLTDEKGMFCSRLLADMGAEVIRLEMPGRISPGNIFSWEANLGKRDITLNIEAGEGREILKRLVQTADILVESYPPGYLSELGIGYSELDKINPGLVMASITAFGQSGPYRNYKSCDLVAAALGGWLSVCGEPDTPPLKSPGNQAYYSAGLFGAIGIMMAIWHRHETGRGQHIDISLQECVAATLDHVLVRYLYEGEVAKRLGSLYWNNAFRLFPCRDGYILLSLLQQWETLVEWLDSEGMAADLTDERWQNRDYQLEHIDHITDVLEQWTQTHTANELVEQGQLMHFPWAKVTSIPEMMGSPQLKERNFFIEVEHPETNVKYKFPGAPGKLSQSPWRVGSRAPRPGEDNTTIYRGELELAEDEIKSLGRKGII